jgi:hypothetical protein
MTGLAGGLLGVAVSIALLALIHHLPAWWFDDRALMTPMELPDDELRAAMREVDELTPSCPPISPGLHSQMGPWPEPPPPLDVPAWSRIDQRPPPPAPMPRPAKPEPPPVRTVREG